MFGCNAGPAPCNRGSNVGPDHGVLDLLDFQVQLGDSAAWMRRYVITGQRARASADFLLQNLPSSSGRLDVLLGCVRAALMVSHGLRRDSLIYLVLNGGPRAPRVVRIDGANARYLRPDERSLATLMQKSLAAHGAGPDFQEVRPGVALADGGISRVLEELELRSGHLQLPSPVFFLDEAGEDVRSIPDYGKDPVFFVGDDTGFDAVTRQELQALAAQAVAVGPTSLYAEHALSVLVNELDRREASRATPTDRPS